MKPLLSLALALLFSACMAPAHAQKQETMEGNGRLMTKDISVQPFTALDASGVYELKLTQGNTERVTIEADENLQSLFIVRNNGNKLVIEMKELKNKNLNSKNKLRVHVQFKNLKALDLKMVGNVRSGNSLTFDELDINNQSVGNVDLDMAVTRLHLENAGVGSVTLRGKAESAVVKNNSVGSLQAGDFVVQTLDIDNSGIGSAEVNAAKGLNVQDSFLGKVKNKGAAPLRKKGKVVI